MPTRYPQGILVSCQIPWDEQERLLEDAFRAQVRYYISSGYQHMYIFGTAGEGHAVDTGRFTRIVQVFREETNGQCVSAMVGVIALSTPTVIERLRIAYSAGHRMFQISLPSWGELNDREMMRFFRDVCGAFPDSQFLHYNLPRSRRILTAGEYRRIADAVPNLVATKNTGTTVATTFDLMKQAADLQHFFGESMFPTGCVGGECSLLSSFGPFAPKKTQEFFELGRSKRLEELMRMQHQYLSMAAELQAPTRVASLMDGAYDKMWVRLAGLEMPLRLLSPYESFSEEVFEQCRRILYGRYSDWTAGNLVSR